MFRRAVSKNKMKLARNTPVNCSGKTIAPLGATAKNTDGPPQTLPPTLVYIESQLLREHKQGLACLFPAAPAT